MDRRLLQPRWLVAHVVVTALAVLFVSLGLWQLRRLEERRIENRIGEERIGSEPASLEELLAGPERLADLEYRRASVSGVFRAEDEVLIRSRVHLGTAGFHVVTPLVGERGTAVLVNRGWVPLAMDEVPVTAAPPPPGPVTVEGWVSLTQPRPPLGPEDPAGGRLSTLNRVDIARIADQLPYPIAPVYVVSTGSFGSELPVPVETPQFVDEGPHLGYAIQWFGFALIGVIGYFFLARRRLQGR